MRNIILPILLFQFLSACHVNKDSDQNANQVSSNGSIQTSEYKPDLEIAKQNVTGDYVYVEKSDKGYTYCEFSISQLDSLRGEFTVSLFKDKNETEYTNPQSSISYPLEVTLSDGGQLQVRPQISDVSDWDEAVKKFPGLEKMFFSDGSGWPMQNLYRKEKNFIIAQQNQEADSIALKKGKE